MIIAACIIAYLVSVIYSHRYYCKWLDAFRFSEVDWGDFTAALFLATISGPMLMPAMVLWNYALHPVARGLGKALPKDVNKYARAFYETDRDKRKRLLQR